MPLSKETRDYEILIRFNEDGSIGAQRQSIVEIMDSGAIISATVETPIALTLEEVKEVVAGLTESPQEPLPDSEDQNHESA